MPNTESDKPKPKDWWDKTEIIGKTFGAIFLPLITAYVGYSLSASIQDRAYKVKMVELAMEILKSDPKTSTNTYHVRLSALDVIQKNSEVPFPAEALEGLKKSALELITPAAPTNLTIR